MGLVSPAGILAFVPATFERYALQIIVVIIIITVICCHNWYHPCYGGYRQLFILAKLVKFLIIYVTLLISR